MNFDKLETEVREALKSPSFKIVKRNANTFGVTRQYWLNRDGMFVKCVPHEIAMKMSDEGHEIKNV